MQMNAIRTLTVRGQSQGLDRVEADLKKVSAAQEKVSQTGEGMARTTEKTARRQLSAGRDFQRLMERHDRMIYLQTQLAREMTTVNRAFEQGAVDAGQHARAIQLVESRYHGLVAAEQQARAVAQGLTMANDNLAMSAMRVAAANDNASFSSANVAAQFQDVAVTAAMGMNPIMIALQQGTQLSSVLMTMKNPITGLATAFMSMINPVSLLTIGFVALGAAAIQFFTGANDNAAEATDALKDHSGWLDELLTGYEAVRDAAQTAADAAEKLPEGVVRSDLQANLIAQDEAARLLQERIDASRRQIAETAEFLRQSLSIGLSTGEDSSIVEAGVRQIEVIRDLGLSSESTAEELDQVMVAARELFNTLEDPSMREMAREAYELALELSGVQAEAAATRAALAALNNMHIQVSIETATDNTVSAIERLARLAPELRSAREQARDELNEALRDAPDDILRMAAHDQYDRTIAALDEQDRRRAASDADRQSSAEKMAGSYADLTRGAQDFIASQGLEAQALGMTAQAAAALRFEQDLLNKAANDNIDLSPEQRAELGALAEQMAAAEERTRSLSESFNFGRDVFKGFFSDLRQGLKEGETLWDAFYTAGSNAIDKLLQKAMDAALDQVWMGLWNSILGGMGGGFGTIGVGGVGIPSGGFTPGLTGPLLNANGNVFNSPSLSAYSNQIHDTPKFFQFAKGIGEFAEAGPEAIMPLGRDGRGRLGVRVANENQAPAAASVRVEVHNHTGAPVRQETAKGADGVDVTRIIIGAVNTAIVEGRLDSAMSNTYGVKRKAS